MEHDSPYIELGSSCAGSGNNVDTIQDNCNKVICMC